MLVLAISNRTEGRCRAEDGIDTSLVPPVQIPLLQVRPLQVYLPHVIRAQLLGSFVRGHLGPERLPGAAQLLPDGLGAVRHEHAPQEAHALGLVPGVPVHDLVARRPQRLGRGPQGARDRRRGGHHAVVPHDRDAQPRGQVGLAPRDGQRARVAQPGPAGGDGPGLELDVPDGAGQGPVDALDRLLPGHAAAAPERRGPPEAGPQREDARAGRRDPQAAADVRAHPQAAAPEGDQRRLAAAAPAAGELPVPRVDGAAEDVVDGLGDPGSVLGQYGLVRFVSRTALGARKFIHHGRWDIGLDIEHCPGFLKHRGKGRVIRCRVINMACKTDSRVEALEVEVVLERHRESVKRTDRLARAGKMIVQRLCRFQRPGEACLGEAIYLQRQKVSVVSCESGIQVTYQLVSRRGSFTERVGNVYGRELTRGELRD